MLENVLFYSQAIDQIRESGGDDAHMLEDPAPPPRPRPNKEGIRQRRARNTIASRAALQYNTSSAFIPLPGSWTALPLPPLPPPPTATLERTLAMRSEPELRLYPPAGSSDARTAGRSRDPRSASSSGSSTAVPISRLLPRAAATTAPPAAAPRAATAPQLAVAPGLGERSAGYEGVRRAGLDQPVPAHSDRNEEGPRQRGPHSASAQPRPASTTDSPAHGSVVGVWPGGQAAATATIHSHSRLSVASQLSSVAESVRVPAASIARSTRPRLRPQMSQHSRKVATRLLMRAGLSRIAIRVATAGSADVDLGGAAGTASSSANGSRLFESGEAMASSVLDGESDPNGLQGLRAERRKQVKFVDEFGFMHFEDSGAQEAEQAKHYDAWRARGGGSAAKAPRPRLDLRAGSGAKWNALLESFDASALRASGKVKRLVQAGVSPAARARFYYVLSGAAALERPGEYARLTGLPALAIYDVIERDVARCYPDHV
ncbi:hypothetical protein H4R21_005505, partial [Coemansia helicoidea]